MKIKKKIETILIGFGRISYGYNTYNKKDIITHYKAVKSNNNFKITSFIETNKFKRIKYAKKLNINGFDKLSKIKNKIYPKLAIIATPTKTHTKIIKDILKNHKSISIILCEKPFGFNYKTSKKILQDCKKNKVKIFVNYIRRSDPGVIKVKKIIKKKFNTFTKGVVFYDGSTLNQASHLINLLQFWFGKVLKINKIQSDQIQSKTIGLNFMLNFRNAKIVFIGLNINNFSYASIELISPKGRLQYNDRGSSIYLQKIEKDSIFGEDKLPARKFKIIKNEMNNYQLNVLKQIYLELLGKKNYLCNGDSAIETLKIIDKLT